MKLYMVNTVFLLNPGEVPYSGVTFSGLTFSKEESSDLDTSLYLHTPAM